MARGRMSPCGFSPARCTKPCAVVGTEAKVPRAVQRCGGCADYLPRDPIGPGSIQMRRRADAFLMDLPDYPSRRYRGRGVVLAGGSDRFFASLYVTICALRHVGCTLPIEVWYLGREDEMPAERQALLAPYQVACIDADRVRRRQSFKVRRLDGWELKAFAALHSRLSRGAFSRCGLLSVPQPHVSFRPSKIIARKGAIFWPECSSTPV